MPYRDWEECGWGGTEWGRVKLSRPLFCPRT